MVEYFTHDLIIHIIVFQTIILLVILSNFWLIHKVRKHGTPPIFPMVSILVPARNEEKNITSCIRSLLVQDYPSFEIVVYDDQSSDATRSILERIAFEQPKLKIIAGNSLPDSRLGKNWACAQLARQAKGDLLLFTDADTIYQPHALCSIVTALIGEQADLLTGFPRQEVRSWGERLLVPFFSWALYSFIPLVLAYKLRLPALSGAIGQMMLFRREAYMMIGGHDSVSSSIIDDLLLARRIKAAGLRWRIMNIIDLVSCRMYPGSRAALNGFSKNLFAVFNFQLLLYLFTYLWLAVMFWEPLIILSLSVTGHAPLARMDELVSCIGLSLLVWLIPYVDLGIPVYLASLYPINVMFIEIAAFKSLRLTLVGRLKWKDRILPKSHWKWF